MRVCFVARHVHGRFRIFKGIIQVGQTTRVKLTHLRHRNGYHLVRAFVDKGIVIPWSPLGSIRICWILAQTAAVPSSLRNCDQGQPSCVLGLHSHHAWALDPCRQGGCMPKKSGIKNNTKRPPPAQRHIRRRRCWQSSTSKRCWNA